MTTDLGRSVDQGEIKFLVEKNADGIIVVGENGSVLFANPAAQRMFGRPVEELTGSQIGIPLILGDTTEISIRRPGGDQVDTEIRCVDTVWNRRPARLASLRDVSARKQMEEQLRHSAKMEAVGRLTAGVAHDFNNLLTVVLGNLDSASRLLDSPDGALRCAIDNATHGARRAAVLTERLLAFARRKPLEPRVLDINALVAGMSDLLRRALGERVAIRTMLGRGLWDVETDPTELESAILNLAVNARDAMPQGGELIIETANVELDEAYTATKREVIPGPYVLISVSDDGTGMSPDTLKLVFEPFFTTKAQGNGTGLGLSQVYGFVKQSGGHVALYSELGVGTTARIYLPRAERAKREQRDLPCDTSVDRVPRARSAETILVVEDDEDVRHYTVTTLRDLGYRVFDAEDAVRALALLQRETEIRLLFTDLGLPGGIDGRTLAERARERRPTLPVLITTAYAGRALLNEGRLETGVDLLSKPFTRAALASRIRTLLDRDGDCAAGQRNPRVLVLEDEALLRMFLIQTLADAGCHVEAVGSVDEALTRFRSNHDGLAAAVVDLGLPDGSGVEVIQEIRALRPRLPVILATGFADRELERRFASDSQVCILAKPFDERSLVAVLDELGVRVRRSRSPL